MSAEGCTIEIPLGHGLVTLIDGDDYGFVKNYSWTRTAQGNSVLYAHGYVAGKTYLLHRLIIRARPNEVVDHINRDGLDNRKQNLRLCTHAQNANNKRSGPNKCGFRGVKRCGLNFYGSIRPNNKTKYGPGRKTAIEAAHDYDRLAKEAFGEFALLNFPGAGEAGHRYIAEARA